MSSMVERVSRAAQKWQGAPGVPASAYEPLARLIIAIVIEDCALVAESESIDGCEWIVAKIAARIRAAPEDSAAQAELEKLCS